MGFTNKTTNYGLPQYVASDRPKILTDVNDAYAEIDKQMKANAEAAAAATAAAGVAQTAAENAASKADTAQTTAETSQEGIDSVKAVANNALEVANVADHHAGLVLEKVGQGDIDKVNTTGTVTGILGNSSIVGIGDGTVSGALNSLAGGTTAVINTDNIPYTGGIGGTETSTLTGALEATSTHLSSITGEITTAKNDITTINTEMGTADISDVGDGTVKGAIASLGASGGSGSIWDISGTPILADTTFTHTTTIAVDLTKAKLLVITISHNANPAGTGATTTSYIPAELVRTGMLGSNNARPVAQLTVGDNTVCVWLYYDGSNISFTLPGGLTLPYAHITIW